jgi:hypothetical protein
MGTMGYRTYEDIHFTAEQHEILYIVYTTLATFGALWTTECSLITAWHHGTQNIDLLYVRTITTVITT